MLIQLCKKLEVGMLLLALFYLFSPLVSVSKTSFFQGVKAGDMIFVFVFYLLFVWLWRFIVKESLTFKLSRIDILLVIYGLYIVVLYLFSCEELDREILLVYVTSGLLYISVRVLGTRQTRWGVLDVSLFAFVAVMVWYCLPDSIFLSGKRYAFDSWEFFEYGYMELFCRLRGCNLMRGDNMGFFSYVEDILWAGSIFSRVLAFYG